MTDEEVIKIAVKRQVTGKFSEETVTDVFTLVLIVVE